MTSVNIVLRSSIKRGHHPGNLFLRVIHDRKVKTAATGYRLFAEEWDAGQQRIIYPENDPQRKAYLNDVGEKISITHTVLQGIVNTLDRRGCYTAEDVIDKYQFRKGQSYLLGYVEALASDLRKNEQYRLARAYQTVSRGLVKFNKIPDIPLSHINATMIRAFETDMMNRGLKPNTISYYMRNLQAIYNKAVAARRLPTPVVSPFAGVNTRVHPSAKRALTAEDTTQLYKIDFDLLLKQHPKGVLERERIENLRLSHRLFMFCFFAQGMSFIDMAYLRKENIRDGVCTYYRRKTRQQVEVKLNDGMKEVINAFASQVKDSPYLFPFIRGEGEAARRQYETALRTQNRRLKELAKLAGITDKTLSTHVARHSFATLVRGGGMPAGVISEMLGHSTERMTHNYFASFDQAYSEQAYHIIKGLLQSAGSRLNTYAKRYL